MRNAESSSAANRAAYIFGLVKIVAVDKGDERGAIIQLESQLEQIYGGYTLYVPVGFRREMGKVRHNFNFFIQRRPILATSNNISEKPQCSRMYAGKNDIANVLLRKAHPPK